MTLRTALVLTEYKNTINPTLFHSTEGANTAEADINP